ncbi:MAG: type II toxin-antitoxin system RelE/ParE family toxin [Flavobacteriales bacterium]|nr:type II toxin-antitoxin system RelE/ParE family toxin [Flavobacteriales bacterium]
MKVELLAPFKDDLKDQTDFIARDKPQAARKFKVNILKQISKLDDNPYSNRRSIYYDDDCYRDLVFKGYKVIFKIDNPKNTVFVIGLVNMQKGIK